MKELFVIVLLVFSSILATSQECRCPKRGELDTESRLPIKMFSFNNKQKIGVCGYFEVEKNDTIYSEFTVHQCGTTTSIAEWNATQPCKIRNVKDTLLVEELYGLPIGNGFNVIWTTFYINQFFLKNSELNKVTYFRKDLKKYSATQIKQVLNRYKQLQKAITIKNYDAVLATSNMLFWGYVSGSKQCEVYLNTIEKKFGPFDGAISEEWSDIIATYEHWKKLNQK